jgi:hypothetical protein
VLRCVAFGAGYFAEVPVKNALTEMRRAPAAGIGPGPGYGAVPQPDPGYGSWAREDRQPESWPRNGLLDERLLSLELLDPKPLPYQDRSPDTVGFSRYLPGA